jgi:hypothetical protein
MPLSWARARKRFKPSSRRWSCSPSGACTPITSRCGDGYSGTRPRLLPDHSIQLNRHYASRSPPHGTSRPLPLLLQIIDHLSGFQRKTPKNEVFPVGNRAAIRTPPMNTIPEKTSYASSRPILKSSRTCASDSIASSLSKRCSAREARYVWETWTLSRRRAWLEPLPRPRKALLRPAPGKDTLA